MIKNDLRKKGLDGDFKEPNESLINYIWAVLILIVGASFFMLTIRKYVSVSELSDILTNINHFMYEIFDIFMPVVYLVFFLFLYLSLKTIMTILFCKDKIRSVFLKVLKGKGIPIVTCKEALTVWQTVLIYLVPIVLMYSMMIGLCVSSQEHLFYMAVYITIFIFLSYYMAFDLTLVLYVLFYKVKDDINYISVDFHVYQMTVFNRTYVGKKQ